MDTGGPLPGRWRVKIRKASGWPRLSRRWEVLVWRQYRDDAGTWHPTECPAGARPNGYAPTFEAAQRVGTELLDAREDQTR